MPTISGPILFVKYRYAKLCKFVTNDDLTQAKSLNILSHYNTVGINIDGLYYFVIFWLTQLTKIFVYLLTKEVMLY